MPPETQRASAQIEVPLDSTLAMREADGVKGEAAQPGSGGQILEKQQLSVRELEVGKKLSPERMRSAVEALTEAPILRRAAERAGIHRKTLEYWRRCSEAGQDGYEIEWEGLRWSFHEACEAAVWVAHHTLLDALLDWAFGSIYKIDQDFVDLGMEGDVACARDEHGDYLVDVRQPENKKMLRCLLGLLRSATPGNTSDGTFPKPWRRYRRRPRAFSKKQLHRKR